MFEGLSNKMKYINGLKGILIKFKLLFVLIFFVNILLIVYNQTIPMFLKMLVDKIILENNQGLLIWLCVIMLVSFLAKVVIEMVNIFFQNKINNRMTYDAMLVIWRKYLESNLTEFHKKNTGEVQQILTQDVNKISNFANTQFIELPMQYLLIISSCGMMFYLHWKMAVISLLITPFPFLFTRYLGNEGRKIQVARRKAAGEYNGWLFEGLQSWKDIKTMNIESQYIRRFTRLRRNLGDLDMKAMKYRYGMDLISNLNNNLISKLLIYTLGGYLIINNSVSPGAFLSFLIYYSVLFSSLDKINIINYSIKHDIPSLERIIETLGMTKNTRDNTTIKKVYGRISLSRVSFSYMESKNVLNDISLTIEPGEHIAIVGKSGSGKTTLANLILGIFQPSTGLIQIDDYDVSTIKKRYLYRNIGAVLQDTYFFNMTIKENLRLGNDKVSEDKLIEACIFAQIHEYIESLPLGYDTLIGEKGVQLSGGQLQRLAIARIFINDPAIIIYDEATSALDNETELFVKNAMESFATNKTVITIAHRVNSISDADKIILLDNGSIIEMGTHLELLERSILYNSLYGNRIG